MTEKRRPRGHTRMAKVAPGERARVGDHIRFQWMKLSSIVTRSEYPRLPAEGGVWPYPSISMPRDASVAWARDQPINGRLAIYLRLAFQGQPAQWLALWERTAPTGLPIRWTQMDGQREFLCSLVGDSLLVDQPEVLIAINEVLHNGEGEFPLADGRLVWGWLDPPGGGPWLG